MSVMAALHELNEMLGDVRPAYYTASRGTIVAIQIKFKEIGMDRGEKLECLTKVFENYNVISGADQKRLAIPMPGTGIPTTNVIDQNYLSALLSWMLSDPDDIYSDTPSVKQAALWALVRGETRMPEAIYKAPEPVREGPDLWDGWEA